ncbi:Protein VESA-1 [Aphelenchoides avenae]|nr:Protein VESA-1 [Aphelenchus avenae]
MPGKMEAGIINAEDEKNMPATEEAAAEVFDEINVAYFMESGFDATGYELQKMLSSEFEIDELERERFKLKRQLQVVSKRVSALITKNSSAFNEQVQNYAQVQEEAGRMVEVVTGIREALGGELRRCQNAMAIVANNRRKKMLRQLRSMLGTIKTLHETEYRLKELMQDGDFPGAIQLCVEAKNVMTRYDHYTCVRDISDNLCKALESMESHIDDALAGLTVVFDDDRYALVHSAYKMLNKVEAAAAKLLSFFRATIESSARGVLVDLLSRRCGVTETDAMSYEQLCESVPLDYVQECLRELGVVLCKVLCIYHSALRYHIEDDERCLCAAVVPENDLDAPPIVEKGAFQKGLSDGLYAVFKSASNKYNTLLCCHDLSHLKFDHFIEIVEMSNRFRKFGRHHFGNACGEVAISLEKQTYLYFGQYHRERMEELRMFLENEVFALCPVPLQFTLFDLPEFQFLKESTDAFDDDDARVQRLHDHVGLGEQLDFKLITSDTPNPFHAHGASENGVDESIEIVGPERSTSLERSSSEDSCYMASENPTMKSVMPNLCNTSLNLLRFFGRYIRMTSMLHSIAEQAIAAITQLFDYFFLTIFDSFCRDGDYSHFEKNFTSGRLQRFTEAVRERLNLRADALANGDSKEYHIQKCHLSPCVDTNSPGTLYALAERIVAVESTCFLAKQFELLRPVLESLVPVGQKSRPLQDFYKDVVPVVTDLREAAYGCVATRALNYAHAIKLVSQVNWDINEIQSQHSPYVDFLFRELAVFSERLARSADLAHISPDVNNIIWTLLVMCTFQSLVQGYSEYAKKCSNEGRALMLLDFEQLTRELESMTGIRPIPYKSFVEDYIKAYYLPEDCLGDWIAKHQEYTNAQLVSLLNTASQTTKRAKSRLMNVLEGKESPLN